MQGFETAKYPELKVERSGSKQLLSNKEKNVHTYISKPIKTSRTEGLELLPSTEMLFSDNSDCSKLKKINPWTYLKWPRKNA